MEYKNDTIKITYLQYAFGLFLEGTKSITISPPRKYIDRILTSDEIAEIRNGKTKVLYGVASNNPLAHSLALKRLMEAYNKELREIVEPEQL